MRILGPLLVLAILYLAVVVAVYFAQDRLLHVPDGAGPERAESLGLEPFQRAAEHGDRPVGKVEQGLEQRREALQAQRVHAEREDQHTEREQGGQPAEQHQREHRQLGQARRQRELERCDHDRDHARDELEQSLEGAQDKARDALRGLGGNLLGGDDDDKDEDG